MPARGEARILISAIPAALAPLIDQNARIRKPWRTPENIHAQVATPQRASRAGKARPLPPRSPEGRPDSVCVRSFGPAR